MNFDALYNLVSEHRMLELGASTLDKFKRALTSFSSHIQSADAAELAYLLDIHYEELLKIKQYIKSKWIGNAKMKKLYKDIFIETLHLPETKTPTPITVLFEKFIKGITYFRHQNDPSNPSPIYHRFFSCGVGTEIYRENHLICTHNLTVAEKKRRRPLIERCYLERLIYDALYRHETLYFPTSTMNTDHSQDHGHIFRLDLTRQDYETCFKGHQITVDIEYNGRFPVILRIYHDKNGTRLYEEEYVKEMRNIETVLSPYTGLVTCKKELANGRTYAKVQRYEMEGDWRIIKANA